MAPTAGALVIGQAVVSDPTTEGAGGYSLLAASPAVAAEDADFLGYRPQISDALHLGTVAGPQLGFHRLPSGDWALSRRFVGGRRRGAYRIVVHTLVLGRRALAAVADDPWLLLAHCRYHAAGRDEAQTLRDLDTAASRPDLRELPDLALAAPEGPVALRRQMLWQRLAALADHWGEEKLTDRLGWVLAALEAGRRVLLAQGSEGENLLALAWQALPVRDRLAVGWTTHLGPGGGDLYRLANALRPAETRGDPADPQGWTLAGEVLPTARAGEGGGGRELAAALVAAGGDLAPLYEGLREHGLSLIENGGQVRRWVATGGALRFDGFATVGELAAALARLGLAPGERLAGPGLGPGPVLATAAATVARRLAAGDALDPVLASVLAALATTHLVSEAVTPAVAAEVANRRTARGDRETAVAAIALALAKPPIGRTDAATAGAALVAPLLAADPGSGDGVFAAVLRRVAVRALAAPGGAAESAVQRLAAEPGWLGRLRDDLTGRTLPAGAALTILRAARAAGDETAAAEVLRRLVLPAFARGGGAPQIIEVGDDDSPSRGGGFEARARSERLDQAAESVEDESWEAAPGPRWEHPDAASWTPEVAAGLGDALTELGGAGELVAALRGWDGEAHAAAVGGLREVLSRRPEVGRTVLAELGRAPGEAWAGSTGSLAGLTLAAVEAGTPASDWLPPALAEAGRAEARGGAAAESLRAALARAEVSPGDATAAADRLAVGLQRLPHGVIPGRLHREIVELLVPALATRPERVVPALGFLERLPADELTAWAPVVARLADRLAASGSPAEASAARRTWWLAARDERAVLGRSEAALAMLAALSAADANVVVTILAAGVGGLAPGAGEDALVHTLLGIAPESALLTLRLAVLDRDLRIGRRSLVAAFRAAEDAVRTAVTASTEAGRVLAMQEVTRRLLPAEPGRRVAAVAELLLSPEVWPTGKLWLEREELDTGLRRAGRGLFAVLPPFERVARRGTLLLAIAAALGDRWADERTVSAAWLRRALATRRYDFVTVFLDASERRRGHSFLRSIAGSDDGRLVHDLERAGRDPVFGWALAPHTARLEGLVERR